MNLRETLIPQSFVNKLNEVHYDWDKEEIPNFYDILFIGASKFLGKAKRKDTPVAVIINDEGGKFIFGAQVEYHSNEEKENPDNWSYIMTFNESDITTTAKFGLSDSEFLDIIGRCAFTMHNYMFNGTVATSLMMRTAISMLHNYLDMNTTADAETTVEHEGYFVAVCRIEDGEKVFSITPDGVMKTLIKGDQETEK